MITKTITIGFDEGSLQYVKEFFDSYERNDCTLDPIGGDLLEVIQCALLREDCRSNLVDEV